MEVLSTAGEWGWYLLWSLLLITASLFVYLGLGGNSIVLALALIHGLVTGFHPITWQLLLRWPRDVRIADWAFQRQLRP